MVLSKKQMLFAGALVILGSHLVVGQNVAEPISSPSLLDRALAQAEPSHPGEDRDHKEKQKPKPPQAPAPKSAQPPQSAPPKAVQQPTPPGGAQPPAPKSAHEPPPKSAPKEAQPTVTPPTPPHTAEPKKPEPPAPKEAQPTPPKSGPQQAQPSGAPSAAPPRPAEPKGAQQPPPKAAPPTVQPAQGAGTPSGAQVAPPPPSQAGQPGVRPAGAGASDAARIDQLRAQRQQHVEGKRTIIEEPGRVIIREGDREVIRHDEAERFRIIGGDVRVEQRSGETYTVMRRPDNVEIITVVDASGRLVRRIRRTPDGREFVLIDNRLRPGVAEDFEPVIMLPPPHIAIPLDEYVVEMDVAPPERIVEALEAPPLERLERAYTLDEIRYSAALRDRMRRIDLDTVNFETGSWQVDPDQIPRLEKVAQAIGAIVHRNPNEMFLIEGHTDAVGSDEDNLSLSDRRAESVAVILSQNFGVPPENLTTQGYGSHELKVPTQGPSRENRRVTVRRITPLLTGAAR